MSLHRFFITSELPATACPDWAVPLRESDLHHLSRVLRLDAGDLIVVADNEGREAKAMLKSVTADGVTADITQPGPPRTVRARVALAQGLSRRERMELAIAKTTELGVSEIIPVTLSRSVVKLDEDRGEARTERWQRLAEEAAKQSQRAHIPKVRPLTDLVGLFGLVHDFDVVLVPWEEEAEGAASIGEALEAAGATSSSSVLIVIGPEGGLTTVEVEALQSAGGRTVSLGDTILRTETAAIVATALAIYELGGLGGRGR